MTEQSVSGAVEPVVDGGREAPATAAPTPQIVFRAVDALREYANNPRKHSEEQITQIAGSLVEFGWTVPVLEDAQGVVAGHGRIKAARLVYEQVGCTLEFPDGTPIPFGTVPVLPCDGWSEERRRAYVIVDNQLPENAGWDDAKLQAEVQALMSTEFDMGLLGFDDDVLTVLKGRARREAVAPDQ